MGRAIADIEREIAELSAQEQANLLRALIEKLDAPAEAGVQQAWLEEAERRLAEIETGSAKTFSGNDVLRASQGRGCFGTL